MLFHNLFPNIGKYGSPRFVTAKLKGRGVFGTMKTTWGYISRVLDAKTKPMQAILYQVFRKKRSGDFKKDDVLYAFYDLKVAPATFDIVTFLVMAEAMRLKKGLGSIHVVFVPGDGEGFRKRDLEQYRKLGAAHFTVDTLRWRMTNILIPCCWTMPSCRHMSVCESREEARSFQESFALHVYPARYIVDVPLSGHDTGLVIKAAKHYDALPSIRASAQALNYVGNWLDGRSKGRKVIVITLRECAYEPYRNSNITAWTKFARELDPGVYFPVFIRDTEVTFSRSHDDLPGLTVFPEASWNVELRAALYESSYLNMSVNDGPNVLCLYNNRARYIRFKMLVDSPHSATNERFFRAIGLEPGSQFWFATPYQRLVWEDDTFEAISREFADMCGRLDDN